MKDQKARATTWLIDTSMFKSLASDGQKRSSLRGWIETHEDPLYLSAASLVELEAAIERIRARRADRAEPLSKWLNGLVTSFRDRLHPVDIDVAIRAGRLLTHCQVGPARHRFHDALLVATAQIHGHGLLTKREAVFGSWTRVEVASP
jgi:predicted nucleic acid-binding protein